MIKRKFRRVKKVKELIPDSIAEKALTLNPLTPPEQAAAPEAVPRITNENITEHREEVLKGARKYIYPLQHSKRRIVTVTLSLAALAAAAFFIYCLLALYHFYQYNTFLYRVTQVVPFPIAKADGSYVSYENYLFELRHYVHYYQTQQQVDFSTSNKQQFYRFRQQALNNALDQAYTKILARQHAVSVSGKEVDSRIAEVRAQNRLGSSNKVFEDVLRDYWGWSINDFKRSLKAEILSEKVAAKMDAKANQRAQSVLAQLKGGADFATVAKANSDDPSVASNGGDFGFAITKTNPNVSPEVIDAMFRLKPGQISDIVLSSPVVAGQPPSLQIVKVTQNDGNTVTASHIVINLTPTQSYIDQLKAKQQPHLYVKF